MFSFVHSYVRLFVHSFVNKRMHSLISSLSHLYSFIRLFVFVTFSFVRTSAHSSALLFVHPFLSLKFVYQSCPPVRSFLFSIVPFIRPCNSSSIHFCLSLPCCSRPFTPFFLSASVYLFGHFSVHFLSSHSSFFIPLFLFSIILPVILSINQSFVRLIVSFFPVNLPSCYT